MRSALFLLFVGCSGDPVNAPAGMDMASVDAKDVSQPCDPVKQDCSGGKCTLVVGTSENQRACLPVTGSIAEGKPCTRAGDVFGHDDCDKGLFCTFIDVLPPSAGGNRLCRKLCHADSDCGMNQRCASIDNLGDGLCTETCLPFSDCGSQMSCSDLWSDTSSLIDLLLVCRVAGTTAIGDSCMTNYDCVPNSVCIDPALGTDQRCRALCDANHPCATGTCQMYGSAGFCGS